MITAQMATIPERENLLEQVVASLIPQVDSLQIALNDYKEIPTWLYDTYEYNTKVIPILTPNDMTDANKFLYVENKDGYIFTCDDDLIYPPDYVEKMVGKLVEFDNKVVLTCHGRVFPKGPHETYYKGRILSFHCLRYVPCDCLVHVGGTGVMAWHSSLLDVKYSDFREPDMADIWMARLCYEQYTPIICMAHGYGWIKHLNPGPTIWDKYQMDDTLQTEIINEFL